MKRFLFALAAVAAVSASLSVAAIACEAGDTKKATGTHYSCTCINRGGQRTCVWLADKD